MRTLRSDINQELIGFTTNDLLNDQHYLAKLQGHLEMKAVYLSDQPVGDVIVVVCGLKSNTEIDLHFNLASCRSIPILDL